MARMRLYASMTRAVAMAVTLSACAATQIPDSPVLPEYALKQKVFELKSGLRVVVQEDHTTKQVVLTSTFAAGSKNDPVGKEGLAHFVEHLAFRSMPDGKTQVWDVMKRTGGQFNAFTAADVTSYYIVADKDQLPELMQLEAWRLLHTMDGVTEEVFDVEREVVRNELRLRGETTVGSKMFDEPLRRLFPKQHPLGRQLAGTPESMRASTLADAQAFVKQHYTPNNCTIVIAGDLNPDEVGAMLGKWPGEALFGPGGPDGAAVKPTPRFAETPAPEPPTPVDTKLARVRAPVLEPMLMIAWSLPGGLRGKDGKMDFAATALNVALNYGLERKYKDDLQGAVAGAFSMVDGSVMLLQASLKPGADPEKLRKRLLDTVANTWAAGDDDVQLVQQYVSQLGKWGTATTLVRTSGEPIQSALLLSQHLAATGSYGFYKDGLTDVSSVSWTDVSEFAYKYLKRERAVSVFFEPENDEVNAPGAPAPVHRLGGDAKPNLLGMAADDVRKAVKVPGLGTMPHFDLDNGLRVYTVERKNALVAHVTLSMPGGNATVQPFGLARLARAISRSKCEGHHGGLFRVGGMLASGGGTNSTVVYTDVLSGNLVNGIAELGDEVSCQEASEEVLLNAGEYFDRDIERLAAVKKRATYQATVRFWNELFPNHPFGTLEPDPAQLKQIRYAELQAFVQGHYRPDAATAVVVGNVTRENVQALAKEYLGPWQRGRSGATTAPPAPPPPAERKVLLYDRPGATQTVVSLGCRLVQATPDNMAHRDLAENYLTERLWNIRANWGATYGMYASELSYPGGASALLMGGAVETSQTGPGAKAMLDMLATTASEGPDMATFTTTRWDVGRQFNVRFADADAAAGAILTATSYGWSPAVWDAYPEQLAASTRADVREVLAPCPGHEIVVMVGDAALVAPQLEAAGVALTETVKSSGK